MVKKQVAVRPHNASRLLSHTPGTGIVS